MIRGPLWAWGAAVALALLLGGLLGAGTLPGAGLLLGGLGGLAAGVGLLLYPWLGPRGRWRLRYHAPALPAGHAATLGRSLDSLAAVTERGLALVWRRQAGELTALIEFPAAGAVALRRILTHLLPDLALEPVAAPPPVAGARGFYRWLVTPHQAGAPDPLDAAALPTTEMLAGDFELRVYLVAGGGAVVVHGTPGPGALAAGLRSLWPPLWRPRWRPLRPAPPPAAPSGHRAGQRLPWAVRLFRAYPLPAPWPGGAPPALALPATGGPGTARLDTRTSLHLPLPAGYCCPPGALRLGVCTLGGAPLGWAEASAGAHFLVLGADAAARQATVLTLLAQARTAGWAVLHLDLGGLLGAQLAAHPALAGPGPILWSDLEHPGRSVHPNLLAVPAGGGPGAEARALLLALTEHLAVLESYVRLLGVRTGGGADGRTLIEWAALLLLAHHRARLSGGPGPPVPDLPTLYAAVGAPDHFPPRLAEELGYWTAPPPALADALAAAGAAGDEALTLARATLGTIAARLAPRTAAERRLEAAQLRTRLLPTLDHLGVLHLWRGAATAPAVLLDAQPGPLLLTRLPARRVPEPDAAAARLYGTYLLACVIAGARARGRQGRGGPPALLVLEDAAAWTAGGLLHGALPLLARAGIAVLLTSAQLPPAPERERLLGAAGTWWIGSVAAADEAPLRAALAAQGVTADLPLTDLPAGVTLCRSGPLVATVYADLAHLSADPTHEIEVTPCP